MSKSTLHRTTAFLSFFLILTVYTVYPVYAQVVGSGVNLAVIVDTEADVRFAPNICFNDNVDSLHVYIAQAENGVSLNQYQQFAEIDEWLEPVFPVELKTSLSFFVGQAAVGLPAKTLLARNSEGICICSFRLLKFGASLWRV